MTALRQATGSCLGPVPTGSDWSSKGLKRVTRLAPRIACWPIPPPSGLSFRPAKFQSREEVVTRLQEAVPGFDLARLETGLQTQIIFAEDMELNEAQLVALGVTDSPGPLQR